MSVIKLINEPFTAILAYGITKEKIGDKKILVFNLNSRTFDISIFSFSEGEKNDAEILFNSEKVNLGGEDFDNFLIEHIIKNIILKKMILRKILKK